METIVIINRIRFFIGVIVFPSKLVELFSNEKERQLVFFVLIFKKNFTVSHVPERKEKDCLNCGTTVYGKYCHVCGQENVVPKETFWSMFLHFFYDITHFDSKFFETVKDLVFRPGFLSKEFINGRRAKYLHPVRMYVFTSAVFFLLFFSFFKPQPTFNDSLNAPINKQRGITINGREYKSPEEYDSLQKTLPASERDGWFLKRLIKKGIDINERYRENPGEAFNKLGESVLHRLPYMLLVSLPFFALILKLVYIRRKQFYYADHGIFTIHFYIFSFLLLILVFALDALKKATNWGFIGFLIFLLFLGLFFYLYKAMRNFYGQRRLKTFFKFLFVAFWSFIMIVIVFVFFIFFSAVTL